MFDRKKLIMNFLLDENISPEEKKRRFKIAWDIWENLDDIKFKLKQKLILKLKEKLENEFKDYKVKDNGLIEGQKWGNLLIFKKDWTFLKNEEIGILQYALEANQSRIFNLYIGIRKLDNDKGIPFKGNWAKQKEIHSFLLGIIKQTYNVLKNAQEEWRTSDWWIAWKYLQEPYKGMWQKDFFIEIITDEGFDKVVNYIFQEFLKLKNSTENLINEFVKEFKKLKKEN